MLVGYVRVSAHGDPRVMDYNLTQCSPPVSMNVTCSRTGPAAAAAEYEV